MTSTAVRDPAAVPVGGDATAPTPTSLRYLHAALLAVAACLLVVANRGQWFFKDDWEFLTRRTGLSLPGQLSVWAPHNGHWSTLPVLAYQVLFAVFGMRTYWPWILLLILIHLTAVHLGWRLLRSAGVGAAAATGVALVLALLGSGAENLLWGFQIGFDGAVAAVLGMSLLILRQRLSLLRLLGIWALGVSALMCSGVSVPLMVLPAILSLWRHRVLRTVLLFVVPVAAYTAWFLLAEDYTAHSPSGIAGYVRYVAAGLWGSAAAATGSRIGPVVLALLVLCAGVLARRDHRLLTRAAGVLALASIITVPVVFSFIAFGREGYGIVGASSSRYVYVAAMAGAPAVAVGVDVLLRWRGALLRIPIAALGTFVLLSNVLALQTRADFERLREQQSRAYTSAALELMRAGDTLAPLSVDPMSGYSDTAAVRALNQRGAFGRHLPRAAAAIISLQRLRLELSLQPGRAQVGSRGLTVAPFGPTTASAAAPCTLFRPGVGGYSQLQARTRGGPGSVTFTTPGAHQVITQFLTPPNNPVAAATLVRAVDANVPSTLTWRSGSGAVLVTFHDPVEVCPPAPQR